MATRKSSSTRATYREYTAVPLEDRVRALEKRQRVSDRNRAWQNSIARKLTVSACIYLVSALLLTMILVPAWYICALVPVFGYWLSLLALWLVRDLWENTRHQKLK